jgi:predicted ATP-dependent protease
LDDGTIALIVRIPVEWRSRPTSETHPIQRQHSDTQDMMKTNVHPCDEKLTLSRNMTRLRRAGHELRLRYARFVVVLEAT